MKRKKCRKALKFQEISAFIYSVTVKDGIIKLCYDQVNMQMILAKLF